MLVIVDKFYVYVVLWIVVVDVCFLVVLQWVGIKVWFVMVFFGIQGEDYEGGILVIIWVDNCKLSGFDEKVWQIVEVYG